MLVHASVSKGSNSPQHGTCCSPACCVCVDERQPSWCSGSSYFTTGTHRGRCRSGLGKGGVLSCCCFLPVTFHKGKQVWGHSPEAVSSHHLWMWVFYFFPKRPLILEGKRFHSPHFRLLCIASIRQSLLSCCFIFLSGFGTCRRTSYFLLKDFKVD